MIDLTREFVYAPRFEKKWDDLGLTPDALAMLEETLALNPDCGAVMQGTGGLRKMRWALPHRGKSGSIRVLYIDFVFFGKLYLIDLYTKDEKENLSQAERNQVKLLIKMLEEELRK